MIGWKFGVEKSLEPLNLGLLEEKLRAHMFAVKYQNWSCHSEDNTFRE
jgi:hypothetical protein